MKVFLKLILTIFSILSIIVLILSYILKNTVLSKNYILNKMEETHYYEKMYDLCYSNFENYIYQSGFDENVIENIVTIENITEDTNIVLSNIYDGKNEKINIDVISENIQNNIKNNYSNFEFDEKNVKEFINCIVNEYDLCIMHTNYEENIYKYKLKIDQILNKEKYIAFAILLLCIVMLVFMEIKTKHKLLQKFQIIFLTNFIIIFAIFFNIIYNVDVEKIQIFNNVFSMLIISIFYDILNIFIYINIVLFIILIILTITLFKLYSKIYSE